MTSLDGLSSFSGDAAPVADASDAALDAAAESASPRPGLPDASDGGSAVLFAHWKLDEGSGAIVSDSSGNGRDGMLRTGATWTAGLFGNALRCNGAGGGAEIDIPGFGASTFSAFAWVNSADASGSQSRILGFNGDDGYAYFNFGLGKPYVEARDSADISWSTLSSAVPVSVSGAWHHLGMVIDRATGFSRTYVDGELVTASGKKLASDAIFGVPATTHVFEIGSQDATTLLSLEGTIDDVRLYLGVPSDAQILELARKP